MTSHDLDTVVIGAGVVGLATAFALSQSGREVTVLERHRIPGSETSSRNSEVIHAGIYYPPDSLKARLCIDGKRALYDFCATHGVAHRRTEKLIVATTPLQIDGLKAIAANAAASGVTDLEMIDANLARALETKLTCVAALRSPSTGIVDTHEFMTALEGGLTAAKGQVVFGTNVHSVAALQNGGFRLNVSDQADPSATYSITCARLVASCGLHASKLAQSLDWPMGYSPLETRYARGCYFSLAGKAPFSRLVYPVPEPGGLGVHITVDLAGRARFGPDVEWIDEIDYTVSPARADKFYAEIRKYWPDLPDGALQPDYAGIRPKISRQGEPAADFAIHGPATHGLDGLVWLYGIESPGITSSLAIGAEVVRELA